jgi:hypothetical protein
VTIFLKSEPSLDAYRRNEAWARYEDAFASLEPLAVQAHLMTREQFDEQVLDDRLEKIQLLDPDGNMVGLATVTNNLAAVPLISRRYFEAHYPQAYAARQIWYVPFVAIPDSDMGAFTMLIEHVYNLAAPGNGIVVFDACNHNIYQLGFARAIEAWTIRLSGGIASAVELDAQHFVAFDVTGAHGPSRRRLPNGMGVRR